MNHPAAPLPLDAEDRSTLEMWARRATAPHRVVSQAKALLMAGDGVADSRIATAPGISRPTVLDWRARFRAEGLDSVGAVRPGRGRRPEITADQVQGIEHSTLHETPPGATHWSCRSISGSRKVTITSIPGARVPKNVQIGRKNGMTRSVGADWGPQIPQKSLKS